MSKVNIQGLIENYKGRTTIYTPLVEAVVNSIQAIGDSKRKDGEIRIRVLRLPQEEMNFEGGKSLAPINSVEVIDNGVGFNSKNRDSFDTVYSNLRKNLGGKGFGRFTFHKYFKQVEIDSLYTEDSECFHRQFSFGKQDTIIEHETNTQLSIKKEPQTTIKLQKIKEQKFDKELDTIARKLVEHLLIYFIRDDYICPKISLEEEDGKEPILLNEYIQGNNSEIKPVATKTFELKKRLLKEEITEKFEVKIFKFYYRRKQSSISLTADNREVTETALHSHIPEFVDEFFEDYKNAQDEISTKNFTIKTYVLGPYLDKHVLPERGAFEFLKDDDLYSPFSQQDIEAEAAAMTKAEFSSEVKTRQEKKYRKITDYVNEKAPWHKPYLQDLDLTDVPYNLSEESMELELQKVKFREEQETMQAAERALANENSDLSQAIADLMDAINHSNRSDLARYVCNRKIVLEFFLELLKRGDDGSAKYEKDIHNLIFPMGKDSTNTTLDEHNLWLLDERFIFSDYVASDKKINKKTAKGEPDLLIFNQKNSFREGDNELSNPLFIFEFKRPKRTDYPDAEDPIKQIGDYLLDIRAGKYETPQGIEKVKVNEHTPVYGYLICDLADRVKYFAEKVHGLTITPDGEGYFGFLTGFEIPITVMSYKKLLSDAKMRNAIFFKMLGISPH